MISVKAINEIEECIDDLVDSCKTNIHYAKNSIKSIKRKLSKSGNDTDKISLENDTLFEYGKFIEFQSNILESLYQCNPGHDAIIAICFCVIDNDINDFDYSYAKKLLSNLMNNNTHGISELYFRDEIYLVSLISILDTYISSKIPTDVKTDYTKYNIDKVMSIIKKNHKIDNIDANKVKYVADIYNRVNVLISYF